MNQDNLIEVYIHNNHIEDYMMVINIKDDIQDIHIEVRMLVKQQVGILVKNLVRILVKQLVGILVMEQVQLLVKLMAKVILVKLVVIL